MKVGRDVGVFVGNIVGTGVGEEVGGDAGDGPKRSRISQTARPPIAAAKKSAKNCEYLPEPCLFTVV